MAVGEQAPSGGELLSFVPLADGNGINVVDRIERRHLAIETGTPVSTEPVSTDAVEFPVDEAVRIETDHLFIRDDLCVVVWNSLGFMISEITSDSSERFPRDRYVFELPGPIRIYVTFEAACSVSMTGAGVRIEPDATTELTVGARSYHKRPATTITTTDRVDDLMRAISHFGSGLKTTSCERSYPSNRGHPPTLEIGERLHVPSVLGDVDADLTIEVPEDLGSVFTVATLAYYLGAEVVPGDEPRIVTDDGFVHPLDASGRSFEEEAERVLKQVFFLDCITRTEGRYQIDLHERNQVEPGLDLDLAALYDEPLATQVETYLDVPYRLVEPHLPKWKLTAHVTPTVEHVETLPFLANDLAVIKTPEAAPIERSCRRSIAIEDFVRGGCTVRSGGSPSTAESAPTPSLVSIEEEDSVEQTWIGEGAPVGASKAMPGAYYNRLGRTPSDDDIDITVVCNAPEMNQEKELVDEVYGSRDELPFDVSEFRDQTVDELRSVLESDVDFLHYIGHIDAGGFECSDGRLDAASLDHTGVDVFFLNACTSYEQGRHLIAAGSIGGVVTLQDVINSGAERVGMTLARLLNCGFPLRVALDIARGESIMGSHYLVIGDGSVDVAQSKGLVPNLCSLSRVRDDWRLRWSTYPTSESGMGTVTTPFIDGCDEYYLASGDHGSFSLDDDELRSFLQLEEVPVEMDGQLTWSTELLD